MRSQRLAIGDNYIDNPDYTWEETNGDGGEIDYLADLVVEGNVGIGTTNPVGKLTVFNEGVNPGTNAIAVGWNSSYYYTIGRDHYGGGQLTFDGSHNASGGKFAFMNGNVGIGTTNPTRKLEVYGSSYLTDMPTTSSGGDSLSGWGLGSDTWPPKIGNQIPYTFNYHTGLAFSAHSAYGGIRFYNQAYPDVHGSFLALQVSNNYVSMPGGHGDLAENYQISGTVLRGSLVSVSNTIAKTAIASSPAQSNIIGVVSTNPGAVMDVDGGFQVGWTTKPTYTNEKAPVTLVGMAPTLVTSQNGSINIGDAIGISTISGFGAKMITAGNIVGKALEKLDTGSACQTVSSIESIVWPEDDGKNSKKPCFKIPDGTYVGKIMVAVNVSWYDPAADVSDLNEESAKEVRANVSNLLETVKKQQKQIEGLKSKIEALKAKLNVGQ
jgi:hypothetical protein